MYNIFRNYTNILKEKFRFILFFAIHPLFSVTLTKALA